MSDEERVMSEWEDEYRLGVLFSVASAIVETTAIPVEMTGRLQDRFWFRLATDTIKPRFGDFWTAQKP